MKVFISWSGETSQAVALALRDWLPSVLQSVQPYVSSEDIEKGARWSIDVGRELDDTSFGILCVTASNVGSPWLNFEAGALAKSMDTSRVSPVLIGLRPADLVGPLAQFQATLPEQDEIARLSSAINSKSENPIDEVRLQDAVRMWWPQLEERLQAVVEIDRGPAHPQRSVPDMVVELLEITRGLQKELFREDRLGEEFSTLANESLLQSRSYRDDVLRAISRTLPSGAFVTPGPRFADCGIKAGNKTVLVDISNPRSRQRYIERFQRLLDEASHLSLGHDPVMLLLVTNFAIPASIRSEIELAPAMKWVLWGTQSDDDELKDSLEDLLGYQ